jgi:hypothetical protein
MKKIAYIFLLTIMTILSGCREDDNVHYHPFKIKNSLQENIYYEVNGSFGEKIGEISIGEKVYIGEIASSSFIGLGLHEIKIYTDNTKIKLLYSLVKGEEEQLEYSKDGILFDMTEDKIIK